MHKFKPLFIIFVWLGFIPFAEGREPMPVREFLNGNGSTHQGLAFENPSLVELMSLAHNTLATIQDRIHDTKEDLKDETLSPIERNAWEVRLRRARIQYRLAWELMRLFVKKSFTDYDLRGAKATLGEEVFADSQDPEVKRSHDREIKGYIIDQANQLFLASIKFLSLKHEPVIVPESLVARVESARRHGEAASLNPADVDLETYAWLDRPEFALDNPNAASNFIRDESIQLYTNINLYPLAKSITAGFKQLVDRQEFIELNLNTPPPAGKRVELARKVLGNELNRLGNVNIISPLVLFYTNALGTLIDAFNINTHDSFDLARCAFAILFKHVLDTQDFASLTAASEFVAIPAGEMPNRLAYKPLKQIVEESQDQMKRVYLEDTASGPKLQNAGRDARERNNEYEIYHGSLLKDLFGKDMSHWIFPASASYDASSDPRLQSAVKIPGTNWAEGRTATGEARDEIKSVQDGDLWMEKGTGMGSDLIAWATQPATSGRKVESAIKSTSIFGMVKSKMYDIWAGRLGWLGQQLQIDEFPSWLLSDHPGTAIDYTGTSHTGLVETHEVDGYPLLSRADLTDSFPNLVRQAWRRHGCGHNHSRLCMFLRVRKEWALEYAEDFERRKTKLEIDLLNARGRVPGPDWLRTEVHSEHEWILGDDALASCRYFLTKTLDFKTTEEMMQYRDYYRKGATYCNYVLQYEGMKNFKTKILDHNVHRAQSGEDRDALGARLVREMGKLVTEKARNIRNQTGAEEGYGTRFDDRFDSFGKAALYCSEHAELSYKLAWGQNVYPESQFKSMLRQADHYLPESLVSRITGGFIKVPWEENDTVFAPKGVIEIQQGRAIWEVIGEMRRAFFGVVDE